MLSLGHPGSYKHATRCSKVFTSNNTLFLLPIYWFRLRWEELLLAEGLILPSPSEVSWSSFQHVTSDEAQFSDQWHLATNTVLSFLNSPSFFHKILNKRNLSFVLYSYKPLIRKKITESSIFANCPLLHCQKLNVRRGRRSEKNTFCAELCLVLGFNFHWFNALVQ
jgi:hypothetical protein